MGWHDWHLHKRFGCNGFDAYHCQRCGGYGLSWWNYLGREGVEWHGTVEPTKNQWGVGDTLPPHERY
jgi:hypothetical protein